MPLYAAAIVDYCDIREIGIDDAQRRNEDRTPWRRKTEHREYQMSYLLSVANDRPMLRLAATIILAFTCAAPFALLLSGLVAYGLDSLVR
jgi:hypothetical protein